MKHGFGTAAAKSFSAALALSAGLGLSATGAQALTYVDTFAGTDCQGNLAGCYATQTGVTTSSTSGGSPGVIKFNADDNQATANDWESVVPSVNYADFDIDYFANTNDLTFTYLADLGDPTLHYVAVKQGGSYALWYDSIGIAANTLYTLDLDLAGFTNPNNGRPLPGWSHITFYNTGGGGGGNVPPVPEPATWAMMILGMAAIGASMRRRKQQAGVRFNFA